MNKNTYDLIVHGYDWGPAVDKIILHMVDAVESDFIKPDYFLVSVKTFINDWSVYPPLPELLEAKRTVLKSYFCDKAGNPVGIPGNNIALELSVHPENSFSNPFLYSSDLMNHWQKTYDVEITNSKLDLKVNQRNKILSPEADQFIIDSFMSKNINLTYGLWKPEKQNNKLPLIIWLHGMGEGGTDPKIALLGNKVVNLISSEIQSCFENGAIILVPQVNGFWMQIKENGTIEDGMVSPKSQIVKSYYTEALYNLILSVINNNPEIDTKRIYIGGCSNGGYMTINMLLNYPELFAAAYPVCEAYPDVKITENQIKILAKQHLWFTQSKDDKTVIPELHCLATVKRILNENPIDLHLTLWDSVKDCTGNYNDKKGYPCCYNGHFSWIYTLNNQCKENNLSIFEWMSKISK